ncbi:MAG: hypothetical protein QOI10_1851 [Solirubrobacterales bacterium]|jgi:hypothetical protein|nr:hypothetical protein [Solirubrobacterales bacterium]
MNKMARWTSLILVALCALAPAAIAPVSAIAQGAENEYDLDLPGSGGNSSTPNNTTGVNDVADSDSGGFPVIVLVLAVAAGVVVGLALWRLRTRQALDEMDDEPGPDDAV